MKRFTGVSALALCAMLTPAWADVTPEQVWTDLTDYMASFGYEVSGQEAVSGGDLVVSDVVMSFPMAEVDPEGAFTISMESLTFADNGNGTVTVTFPPVMPIDMSFVPEGEDERVDMVIEYTHEGLNMVVSGEAEAMTYDYAATMLGLRLAGLMVDDEVISRDMARVDVTMGPVEGRTEMATEDGMRAMAQVFSLGDLTYDMAFNDPESDEGAVISGEMRDLVIEGDAVIPQDMDFSDPMAIFASGMEGAGAYTHQGGRMEFSVTEDAGATSGTIATASGEFGVAFAADALSYFVANTEMALNLSGPEIPFPVSAEMAEASFDITVPLQASDTPQDAALGVTLGGFTTSEMLWNIVDPGAVLPRDPLTVSFDLLAKVTPFVSLMDAEAMEQLGMTGGMPGELNALTLTELVIEGAGGLITGAGDFTFDNSDLESFDGLPRPEGALELEVSGANGLIDSLIQMGLLAEEDAMGARMMMSMFTVPGDAPDTASSRIEVNEQGHVLANGQRIK